MIFHSKIYIANRVIPHFLIRTLNCLHLSAIKYTNIFLNNYYERKYTNITRYPFSKTYYTDVQYCAKVSSHLFLCFVSFLLFFFKCCFE